MLLYRSIGAGEQHVVVGSAAGVRALLGFLGFEAERGGVYAVALAGRRGAVVEDVALMRPARGAVHLRTAHEEAAVFLGLDVLLVYRRPEARPARTGVVLGRRA